jgi:glycosyltransferase involved in cell wall biosynthesis
MAIERQVDVVYSNTSAIFEPAIAARLTRIPHLWHIHEVLSTTTALNPLFPMRWMRRFIRAHSALVLFESHAARAAFEDGQPLAQGAVVSNSVRPLNGLSPDRHQARIAFDLKPNQIVVGFIGQLIDRKNPLLLIECLRQIQDERVVCLLAGHGPLAGAIDDAVVSAGLTNRVRRLPFQSNVRPLLEALDILVLPSREESFGLVLAEAAACGKPVVACHSQGPNEIIADNETGFLVAQDDAEAMAGAIKRLAQSDELRRSMGVAGQRRVSERFDAVQNTRRLEELMSRLTAGHERAETATFKRVNRQCV